MTRKNVSKPGAVQSPRVPNWTDAMERQWQQMTEQREQHKADVGRVIFVQQLREVANCIERGEQVADLIKIEYVRQDLFGHSGTSPVIGRRLTAYLPNMQVLKAAAKVGGVNTDAHNEHDEDDDNEESP